MEETGEKAEEMKRKKEQREVKLERDEEKTKQMYLESQKIIGDFEKGRKRLRREIEENRRIYCADARS